MATSWRLHWPRATGCWTGWRPGAKIIQTHVKRFDPLHLTIDFPRRTVASIVTTPDTHGLSVQCEFLRKGDLVGLIYESEDRFAHPAHARETSRDYSHCVLQFRWQSSGVIALDALNGPTLTIEGQDASGNPRTWFVRLWNYAIGSPTDAAIKLDFDELDGGFGLPADADRVDPRRIDRMFISLVAPGYESGSAEAFAAPVQARVTLSGIGCNGSGSVLAINDAVAPEHVLRIATAYDDLYNLTPERIVDAIERLGYRGVISHYIGMSHYFALTGAGELDPARTLNSAALAWQRDFARAAKSRGYQLIWSLSYEILDMFCPEAWKQRMHDGTQALTAWNPPSTLINKLWRLKARNDVEVEANETGDGAGGDPMITLPSPPGAAVKYSATARFPAALSTVSTVPPLLTTTSPYTRLFVTRIGGSWETGVLRATRVEVAGAQVVGAQAAPIASPAGGTTIDLEARGAVDAILGALRQHGLIET
jgi:hypothetical protein